MTALPQTLAPPRSWLALVLGAALLVLPDCCLLGHHQAGAGMAVFGSICRAAR